MAEREGPVGNRSARTAGRGFGAAAGVLWLLAGATFGYLGLVQLGFTGEYSVPDPGSATLNAVAALVGLAIGVGLLRRASSSGLRISVAGAAVVVVGGGYQLTQGVGGVPLALAIVVAGLAGSFSVFASGRVGWLTRRGWVGDLQPALDGDRHSDFDEVQGAVGSPVVPDASSVGRWRTLGRRDAWVLLGVLGFAVVLPAVLGALSGSLDIARLDDWSYRRIALNLYATGRLGLDGMAATMLLGQVIITQPLLWLAGGHSWAFVAAGVAFGSSACVAGYLTFRRFLSRRRATLAILLLPLFPGYLPYATSFMTDAPALAAQLMCLGLGMVALEGRPIRTRWFLGALAVGVFGYSIREFAVAAPAAVLIAAVLAEPRRWRHWCAGAGVILACLAIAEWRSLLPGQLGPLPRSGLAGELVPLGISSVALVLMPAAVISVATWWRRWRVLDLAIGICVGFFLVGDRVQALVTTGAMPRVLLGVIATRWGTPWVDYLAGDRPVLFPDAIWAALNGLALVATVFVVGTGSAILLAHLRNVWRRPDSIRSLLRSPLGLLAIYTGGVAAGLAAFGLYGWSLQDRYCWPLAPALAALMLSKPATLLGPTNVRASVEGYRPSGRLSFGRAGVAGIGAATALALAILGAMSLAYLLNSDAFDAARWRAGEALVRRGIPADSVDAGVEWVGYYTTSRADSAHAVPAVTWWESLRPSFHLCGLVSSSAIDRAGLRLDEIDTEAYRLLLFDGPQEPLYLYRVAGPQCP